VALSSHKRSAAECGAGRGVGVPALQAERATTAMTSPTARMSIRPS
jgi:hypothetical protein